MTSYWRIAVEEALCDAGLSASDEQIDAIAKSMEFAREMESESCGYTNIPDPRVREIADLRSELKRERELVHCETCNGRGRVITNGPYHCSNSPCWVCNGEGKITPAQRVAARG